MSSACCSFCEDLPGIPDVGWGGRASRCPVCRQTLWTTGAGATYRLDPTAPAPTRRIWPWLASGAGLVSVCAIVVALLIGSRPETWTPVAPERPATIVQHEEPSNEPLACAKPSAGENPSRAKRAAVAKAPPRETVASAAPQPTTPPVKTLAQTTVIPQVDRADHTTFYLLSVPEVDLDPQYMKKSRKEIDALATSIARENAETKDTAIRNLMTKRSDLAGMPFLMGKDCTIAKEASAALALGSLDVRSRIAQVIRQEEKKYPRNPVSVDSIADLFWSHVSSDSRSSLHKAEAVPALQQILLAENRDYRGRLVEHMNKINDPKATELLANRAVFDFDPEVRALALQLLRDRAKDDYKATLLKGLRYPWQPVVRNAAHAIRVLELKEAIPELIDLLDEPDPASPRMIVEDGKPKHVVRELVRINHHRNCMLCHAPLLEEDTKNISRADLRLIPVGPVPVASDPLPPSSSPIYYSAQRGILVARADVTYLRQDFSMQQAVENPGKWSKMQRFDFLVRTRVLTEKELESRPALPLSPENQEAILVALQRLTNRNAAPHSQAWRDALGMPAGKARMP